MASLPLTGKVALITGGSKGIGRATALRLAKDGASVVVNYSSDATAADEVVSQIGADRALAVKADVSSISEIEHLVNTTVVRFGKIDILIPNAAVLHMMDLASTTEEAFDRAYAVNVKGPYFLAQKAEPHMAKGSRVVFFSTTQCHASTVTPNYLLYCSTKGAIEQMTRILSKGFAAKGIIVNCVAPGPTGTELFYKGKSEQLLNFIKSLNPQGRIGTTEEVADVVAFLSSEACGWMVGQVLRTNGGMA